MLTELHSITVRSIVAQPPTFVLPALGLQSVFSNLQRRLKLRTNWGICLGLSALLVIVGQGTYQDYFIKWGQSAETKKAYFSDLYEALKYIDKQHPHKPILISTPFPNLPHDPYVAQVMPLTHKLDIRWFDGRRAIQIPSDISVARLAALSRAPLTEDIYTNSHLDPITQLYVPSTDYFVDIFDLQVPKTLQGIQQGFEMRDPLPTERENSPIEFGESVELIDYKLITESSAATIPSLITFWRVLNPEKLGPVPAGFYGHDVKIFVHLLDEEREIVAQEDRLDAPAWNWQPGDYFLQIHHLPIDPQAIGDEYEIRLGLYTTYDLQRLPVCIDGVCEQDYLQLKAISLYSNE
jgi:hypothetical protein